MNTQHVTTAPAPAPRSLYLAGSEHKQVGCTDAALVVENARGQIMRYPLDRVARVVSSPRVDWDGKALLLCQQHGVPITWLSAQGDALGTLYPVQPRRQHMHHQLDIVLETASGWEAFAHWLQHRRMQVLQAWGESQPQQISPSQWEQVKRQWIYRHEPVSHLPRRLLGLCTAFVAAQLSQLGLLPVYAGPQGQGLPLQDHLVELTWVHLNLCAGPMTQQSEDEATQVALIERWLGQNAGLLLSHLHSLQRWVGAQMTRA